MSKEMFTTEEVAKLHQQQFGPWNENPCAPIDSNPPPRLHPYTCPNRSDGNHFDTGSDLGILVPTTRGWICQCCDYTQDWAHGAGKE